MHTRFSLLLAVVFLAGCATTQSLPVEERSRTFDASYNQTFRAIVAVLTESGYAVTEANSDAGVINTDYKQASGWEAALIGRSRTKYTVLLSEVADGSRAIVTLAVEDANAFGAYSARSLSHDAALRFYDEFFERVEAQLDGQGGS